MNSNQFICVFCWIADSSFLSTFGQCPGFLCNNRLRNLFKNLFNVVYNDQSLYEKMCKWLKMLYSSKQARKECDVNIISGCSQPTYSKTVKGMPIFDSPIFDHDGPWSNIASRGRGNSRISYRIFTTLHIWTVQQLSWGLWCWWVGIVHSWCAYSTRQSSALHDGSLDHPETHQQKEFSSLVAWFLDQIEGTVVIFAFSSLVVELCRVVTRSVWETQLMRVVFGLDWAFDAEEGLLGLYRCSTSLMEYQYC